MSGFDDDDDFDDTFLDAVDQLVAQHTTKVKARLI